MKCTASAVIAIAKSETGYLEKASNSQLDSKTANAGSANYTKYARDLDAISGFYNGRKQGYPWCDVFFDWLFVQAFGIDNAKRLLCQPDKSYGAGVDWSARYFAQADRLYDAPQPGDQIFFLDSSGEPGHTGLVTDVRDGRVYTIEGNTSGDAGVVDNGGGVWAKSYDLTDSRIYGYGRPDYDAEPEKNETEAAEMRYNTLDEVPAYAKATIQKLMDKDYLVGTADGLDLSIDMIRLFVINDRAGLYD